MIISLDSPDAGAYVKALSDIISSGAKSIFLHGGKPDHFDTEIKKIIGNINDVKLVFSSLDVTPAAVTEQIRDNSFDAAILFPSDQLRAILAGIGSLANIPHIAFYSERPARIIVVSVHKSGTNLVAGLFRALGYTPVGEGIKDSYHYLYAEIMKLNDKELKMPPHALKDPPPLQAMAGTAPPGSAMFLHNWPIVTCPRPFGPLLSEWVHHRNVPVIFNFRDPRAVLSSFIHYLTGKANEEPVKFPPFLVQAQILKQFPTADEQFRYAVNCLDGYMDWAFRQHFWLYYHPDVCNVNYESLVGENGGGSKELQHRSVYRLMTFLGIGGDPAGIADGLYNSNVRTFRKGSVDAWREDYSESNLKDFQEKYRDILEVFGYPFY